MDLSRRQRSVLRRTVECYVHHGEPVASRQVAKASEIHLSPATVRHVMSELEEAGFVERPHPSAGCVPTDLALRAFVDSLNPERRIPPRMKRFLEDRIETKRRELVEDLDWVPQLLADVTSEAGVAVRPMADEATLEGISLVRLGQRRVLGVLVTADGAVEHRVVRLDRELPHWRLQEIENAVNRLFAGRSLSLIREAALEGASAVLTEELRLQLGEELSRILSGVFSARDETAEVQIAGTENLLLSDDFERIDRMRSLTLLLSDRRRIVHEWRRLLRSGGTQVAIGRESDVTASGRLATVATLFFRNGRKVGAVGIVGPRRMDYQKIVPVVEYIGNRLTKMLDEGGAAYG